MHVFNSWYQTMPEWRLSFLRNRIAEIELSGQTYPMLHAYFKQFEASYLYSIDLQGSTGEESQLYWLPRGKALIEKDKSEDQIGFIQVVIALLTGNQVYCDAHSSTIEQLQAQLIQSGFGSALCLISSEEWHAMLGNKSVSIISVIDTVDKIQALAFEVALQHCMIPQFIYEVEKEPLQFMTRPDYLTYWMYEKTQTINTTAVGGNAKLLNSIGN